MPLASGAERAAASWLLAGPSPGGAGLPLVPLRSSPRHKSLTPDTAHRAAPLVVFVNACHGFASRGLSTQSESHFLAQSLHVVARPTWTTSSS
jgi:hypothetical protein